MTIETGIEGATAYIDTLDDTYPAGGDDLVEGDNHIRGIKNCLLNSFPAITGAVTSTHTELNILDGVTSTTAELNILDGVTSTAAELNILDGVTSTAAELNILDGVTSTAAELNYLDLTTGAGTAEASKALVLDGSGNITGINYIRLDSANPILRLKETDAATDNDVWDIAVDSEALAIRLVNTNEDASTNIMTVARTGMTVDSVTIPAPVVASGGVTGDLAGKINGIATYSSSYSTGSISPSSTHTETVTEATTGITTVYGLIVSLRVTAGTATYDELAVRALDDTGNTAVAHGNYAWTSGTAATSGNIFIETRNNDTSAATVTVNYTIIGT